MHACVEMSGSMGGGDGRWGVGTIWSDLGLFRATHVALWSPCGRRLSIGTRHEGSRRSHRLDFPATRALLSSFLSLSLSLFLAPLIPFYRFAPFARSTPSLFLSYSFSSLFLEDFSSFGRSHDPSLARSLFFSPSSLFSSPLHSPCRTSRSLLSFLRCCSHRLSPPFRCPAPGRQSPRSPRCFVLSRRSGHPSFSLPSQRNAPTALVFSTRRFERHAPCKVPHATFSFYRSAPFADAAFSVLLASLCGLEAQGPNRASCMPSPHVLWALPFAIFLRLFFPLPQRTTRRDARGRSTRKKKDGKKLQTHAGRRKARTGRSNAAQHCSPEATVPLKALKNARSAAPSACFACPHPLHLFLAFPASAHRRARSAAADFLKPLHIAICIVRP